MYVIFGFLFCLFYALNKLIVNNSDPNKKKKIKNIHDLWENHLDGGAMFLGFILSPICFPIMSCIFLFNLCLYGYFAYQNTIESKKEIQKNQKRQKEAIIRRVNERLGID